MLAALSFLGFLCNALAPPRCLDSLHSGGWLLSQEELRLWNSLFAMELEKK